MKKILVSIALSTFALSVCRAQNVSEAYDIPYQGSYTPSFKCDGTGKRPKNIILMIGDGMGLGQLSAGMFNNRKELTITNLRTCGFVRTQAATAFTTDSGASATAFATGNKTKIAAIGMAEDNSVLQNISEFIAPLGYVSGVISSGPLSGATPSAFFAHRESRGDQAGIWEDFPVSKLSFAAAGSTQEFGWQSRETKDAVNAAFTVVDTLRQSDMKADRLGYFPSEDKLRLNDESFDRGDFLPSSTAYAIRYLDSKSHKKGFFLMVEGANIDQACHGNRLDPAIREVLDFDKAVTEAIRFAEKDGNTLVIVTADHETGMLFPEYFENSDDGGYASGVFSTYGHSPIMVPLFAYGPSSRLFSGVQENNEVGAKIIKLFTGRK